ncbi:hypothetical protein CYMTET_17460 [Cymbomonas tetramitiformis]|uniref:Uncharacterized protein n=1 Tax=Cymbomonas tetramitiformis TaxID=36881 RepID=A0AAE0L6Y5_9CHLO|nr:hypothetical protein CYMTET_17460 [Cymbomonas tetramitiformis]
MDADPLLVRKREQKQPYSLESYTALTHVDAEGGWEDENALLSTRSQTLDPSPPNVERGNDAGSPRAVRRKEWWGGPGTPPRTPSSVLSSKLPPITRRNSSAGAPKPPKAPRTPKLPGFRAPRVGPSKPCTPVVTLECQLLSKEPSEQLVVKPEAFHVPVKQPVKVASFMKQNRAARSARSGRFNWRFCESRRPISRQQTGMIPVPPGAVVKHNVAVQACPLPWTRYYFSSDDFAEEPGIGNCFFQHFDVIKQEHSDDGAWSNPTKEINLITNDIPKQFTDAFFSVYYSHHVTAFDSEEWLRSRKLDFARMLTNQDYNDNLSSDDGVKLEGFCKMVLGLRSRTVQDAAPLAELRHGLLEYLASILGSADSLLRDRFKEERRNIVSEMNNFCAHQRKAIELKCEVTLEAVQRLRKKSNAHGAACLWRNKTVRSKQRCHNEKFRNLENMYGKLSVKQTNTQAELNQACENVAKWRDRCKALEIALTQSIEYGDEQASFVQKSEKQKEAMVAEMNELLPLAREGRRARHLIRKAEEEHEENLKLKMLYMSKMAREKEQSEAEMQNAQEGALKDLRLLRLELAGQHAVNTFTLESELPKKSSAPTMKRERSTRAPSQWSPAGKGAGADGAGAEGCFRHAQIHEAQKLVQEPVKVSTQVLEVLSKEHNVVLPKTMLDSLACINELSTEFTAQQGMPSKNVEVLIRRQMKELEVASQQWVEIGNQIGHVPSETTDEEDGQDTQLQTLCKHMDQAIEDMDFHLGQAQEAAIQMQQEEMEDEFLPQIIDNVRTSHLSLA